MAPGYEQFYDDFSRALRGEKPHYLTGVDLERHIPASANKHMLENAALAISQPAQAPRVFDLWGEWYVTRPLHENEETTSSESYRPAIDYPTLALAGSAFDCGREVLGELFLDRARASLSDLGLSVGCAPPRKIRDEGIPGKRCVLVGDGTANGLKGNPTFPVVTGVGKRGNVRADTPQGNLGPWHYLYQEAQAVMLAQALGLGYSVQAYKRFHGDFEQILRRWPRMRRWGFSSADLEVLRAYFADPANAGPARQVHAWAALHPSNEGRLRVRGRDRSIESIALQLGDSSTGGVAINAQRSDGVTFRTSCDTGTRYPQDIQPQLAEIAGNRIRCYWRDHPDVEMSIARVVTVEAWRSLISPAGSAFITDGAEPEPIPPRPSPGPGPDPGPLPPGAGPLVYLGPGAQPGESVYGSRSAATTITLIHGDAEFPKRWIAKG